MVKKILLQLIIFSFTTFSGLCQKNPIFKKLSFQEIKCDFDTLYSWLKKYHINLYGNISELKLERNFRNCRSHLFDGISEREYYKIIAAFLHSIKDGHTNVWLDEENGEYFEYKKNGGLVFPFNIKIVEGQIIVADNYSNNGNINKGDIIKSINGLSSKVIIRDMLKLWSADYYISNIKILEKHFAKSIWYYYGWGDKFTVTYKNLKSRIANSSIKGIPIDSLNKQNLFSKDIIQFQVINEHLCLLKSNSYVNTPGFSYKLFLDSCFTVIKKNHYQNLILDLRYNSGGNSLIGDSIISYFYRGPYLDTKAKIFRITNSILTTINKIPGIKDQVLGYLNTGKKIKNEYFSKSFQPELFHYSNDSLRFYGKVYVLISPYTYSSAHMTALAVKCANIGILVGEPTGERLGLTGESIGMRLPHSRIIVHIPIAKYSPFCGSESTMGVKPDVLIKTKLIDVINNEDPIIKYIIKMTK